MIMNVLTNCIAIWSNNYRIDFFDKEEGGACLFAFCHAGDFIDQRWRCVDYDIEFNFNEKVQNIYNNTQALLKEVKELGESHDISIVGSSKDWVFRLNSDPEMIFNVYWQQDFGWRIDTDHGYSLGSKTHTLSCLLKKAIELDFQESAEGV